MSAEPLRLWEMRLQQLIAGANNQLAQFLVPAHIVQVTLEAERRILSAMLEYDDGARVIVFHPAQCMDPYVLATQCLTSFLATRVHSVSEECDVGLSEELSDLSGPVYFNAPGYIGQDADSTNELEQARVEAFNDAINGGRRH